MEMCLVTGFTTAQLKGFWMRFEKVSAALCFHCSLETGVF